MLSVTPTHLPVLSLDAGLISLYFRYSTGCQKWNGNHADMSSVTPVLTLMGTWFLKVGFAHMLWASAKYFMTNINQQLSGTLEWFLEGITGCMLLDNYNYHRGSTQDIVPD